jgi:hypothetical protein
MTSQSLFGLICLSLITSGALAGGAPPNSKPLTADEIKKVIIGRTWSGSTPSRPGIMNAQERKLFEQQKGKPSGKFKEYYSPNGTLMGWSRRTDFEARYDGRWRISGNQLCATYKVTRIWKNSNLRTNFSSNSCYGFVDKSGTLLMTTTKSSGGAGIGQYFRPSLSSGNSAAAGYKSVGR